MRIIEGVGFAARAGALWKKRNFLMLQGVCSPFFARLAARLEAEGHRVFKINFNAGDAAYWRGRRALSFREPVEHLPAYLAEQYRKLDITDQIMFGDCRPVHRPAVIGAEARQIRNHVFEEGYFRPQWVTLERSGVNAHSLLPRDPAWYLASASRLPALKKRTAFAAPFSLRALHDVLYHAASLPNPLLYPGYTTHAPINAAWQYAGYLKRLPLLRLYHQRRDARVLHELARQQGKVFLLPLQLDGDAQIQVHSDFAGMQDVMRRVMRSFAVHAPADAHLLIKNHPLDTGLTDHGARARSLARELGIRRRVHFVETGDLTDILKFTAATVTVNSTVGSVALAAGNPTIALADAIYDLPGLTFQNDLDDFWHAGEAPDETLYRAFRKTVIHATQIHGGLYSGEGIAFAVENALPRLVCERSPLDVLG
ncbi:MAG: capsular biosynthesis protein [Candidatus Dactylopiibacterium sp.]|nr:capsular biosynthesis protein [Candidatus Dactylopiibacterium sp.]